MMTHGIGKVEMSRIEVQKTEAQVTFFEQGFLSPVSVLSLDECRKLRAELMAAPEPLTWFKGHAASSTAYARIGCDPSIVDRVAELIGENAMLWGASLVRREPGQIHDWHTDIETSADSEGTASVWIGLENTREASSLRLVPGSHRFGLTIQEMAYKAGKRRGQVTEDEIASWSKDLNGGSSIVQPATTDGDAIIFDGRLWHGSNNTSPDGPRLALLLQYARPDLPIRMPDLAQTEFPFRLLAEPKPPCIMVRGSASSDANRFVPVPAGKLGTTLSWARSLVLPLAEDRQSGWKSHRLFKGQTRCLSLLDCHVSVLSKGVVPHEPHEHEDEELLIVLDGDAELELLGPDGNVSRNKVTPGSFAYYPRGQAHTIHNTSASPVTYVMFKWVSVSPGARLPQIETRILHKQEYARTTPSDRAEVVATVHLFGGATGQLRRLQCHLSTVSPGGGYEPHTDAYDVGLVLLSGTVETLGQRLEAPALAFYSAGEAHGIRNAGADPASYLIFEFHGLPQGQASSRLIAAFLAHMPRRPLALVPRKVRRFAKRLLFRH